MTYRLDIISSKARAIIICGLILFTTTVWADDKIADNADIQSRHARDVLTSGGQAKTRQDIVWIDVRSWFENQISNIEGDPRISYSEIVSGVSELYPDKDTPIRLYCAAGVRAGTATNELKAAGYTNVKNVGGIDQVRFLRGIDH